MTTLYFLWLFLTPLLIGTGIFLVSSQCLDDQKTLLLQLQGSLQFDASWSTKLASWNQTSECCYWDGVTCDSFGHVIGLELNNEVISGGIENSSALFEFQHLERLNLAYNWFNVEIPVGICNLTKLKYLNLSDAGFVGQIPFTLSRLTRLVTLDLSNGDLTLKLENPNLRHFIENATELRELNLDEVDLSAQNEWCQSLSSHLPNLTVLSLRLCQISGPIHESLSKIPSLSFIRLDTNNLSSTVPESFANFSNLTTLSLISCNLHGSFPEKIFQLHALEYLYLSDNELLGGIIPKFPPNGSLKTISLSSTNFSGSLPESISNLQKLSTVELSGCKFNGPIPSTMENLIELVYVNFCYNNFTGSIPYFQQSKKLSYLDLSSNGLTGYLSPAHFEGLSQLSYLNLGNNSLNGILPANIFELPSLGKLLLNKNQFAGQVKEFRNASSSVLDEIDLSNNQLNGSIPKSIFEVERLEVLTLSSNFFCGTVSHNLIGRRLINLNTLDLSYNNLTVDISSNATSPSFPQLGILQLVSCGLKKFPDLKNLSRMSVLDLSVNQIAGPIPNWVWEIGNGSLAYLNLLCNQLEYLEQPYYVSISLAVLDLHSNHINGDLPPFPHLYVDYSNNKFINSIPPDIGNFSGGFLSIANNGLTGRIPESICNGTSGLNVLDFSNNALSGTIPSCLLDNIPFLAVLNLGNNKLGGFIPDSFPIGCALQNLDLSENTLQGKLPMSLVNCETLEVLNVGNNRFVDSFPSMLKNTSSLRVLVLRSNQFYGDFKCYSWKNLQIIDIASNKFTGELSAECLSNWRGMIVEDNYAESGHAHIPSNLFESVRGYYEDKVTITNKGMEMKLVKILRIYTCIDFSSNRFQGVIPEMLGNFSALYALNLSHNALEGPIPKSLGKLRTLESLDLSRNRLSGKIPVELAGLTFLAYLNLSFHKLFGRIPIGTQFSTFSPAFFEGNEGLCGFPLKECKSNASELILPTLDSPEDSEGFDWMIIIVGAGYVAGATNTIAFLWYYEPVKIWFDIVVQKFLIWLSTLFVRLTA